MQPLASPQGDQPIVISIGVGIGYTPVLLFERHLAAIAWQAVEVRAMKTGEGLQPIESACRLEGGRGEFDRCMCRVTTGATSGGRLGGARMWRGIGSDEEFSVV